MQKFNQVVAEVLAHPMADCLPQMPSNHYGLTNGSKIVATKDYPFLGVANGEHLALFWDSHYIRHGNLTWSTERLCNEIANGLWTVTE